MTGIGDHSAYPWRDSDVVMLFLTAITGSLVVIAAWFGVSGSTSMARQATWLNLAVIGFAISGMGIVLWLIRVRRAIAERRLTLISLGMPDESDTSIVVMPLNRSDLSTRRLEFVRIPNMALAHERDCPLVAGKPTEIATIGNSEPCGVCLPWMA